MKLHFQMASDATRHSFFDKFQMNNCSKRPLIDSFESENKKSKTNSNIFRRNIRPLADDETLDEQTLAARQSEEKRLKRLNDDEENNAKQRRLHLDDQLNVADENGNILVNVHHPANEPDLFVSEHFASLLKAHQIGGIRFLYDNVIESLERFRTTDGFGCILAHSMGCGKTLQIIAFIDVFFRFAANKTVLIVVPVNTLQNWLNEFQLWSPEAQRNFQLFFLNEQLKNVDERTKIVDNWAKTGGTLIIGYEMFRLFVLNGFSEKLCQTDLLICDEGHRIKNHHANLFKAFKSIRTKRRIVLTGYPLQNNLIEFWSLVDFVRPDHLGNKQRFTNSFERPIVNGRCSDSTVEDQRLMRERAHILHSLLEGFIQRRGAEVLRKDLPSKSEFVLILKMSEVQQKLYKNLIENLPSRNKSNLFEIFSASCKIWNHPDVFRQSIFDFDFAKTIFDSDRTDRLTDGIKFVVAMKIIEHSVRLGEKVLLFSQSLSTLDKFEEFLRQTSIPNSDEFWKKDVDFSRLDGKTRSVEREKLIRNFNDRRSSSKLFLLSTRAACLGVNLIGASRVIMMDVSWNPCHDAQAVCRVFRYGQEKHCFIYRLIADSTMEKTIYDRQITKQNMSDRVIDELQPENRFTRDQVENLLRSNSKNDEQISSEFLLSRIFQLFDDEILLELCQKYSSWFCQLPFTHESLLTDQEDFHLTFEEKRRAKENFEKSSRSSTTPFDDELKRRGFEIETKILSKPLQLQMNNSQLQILPVGTRVQLIKSSRGIFIRTAEGKCFGIPSTIKTNSSSFACRFDSK